MNEFIGAMAIVGGMFLIAIWLDDKRFKSPLVFGLVGITLGLSLVLIPPSPKLEKPTYSSEWVDEETKCHFHGGKIINCESVRYE
jgi:hypothetical protein